MTSTATKKPVTRKNRITAAPATVAWTAAMIEQSAYYFYEARGKIPGYELEDWLAAEQQFVKNTITT